MNETRVLKSTPATVSMQFVDQIGAPLGIPSDAEVLITRFDNSTLLKTASPDPMRIGTFTASLDPIDIPTLDILTLTWTHEVTGAIQHQVVHVVDSYYFTIDQVLESQPSVRDARAKYANDDIARTRNYVEVEGERIWNQAFVPRLGTTEIVGDGSSTLLLSDVGVRRIRNIWFDDVLLTLEELNGFVVSPIGVLTYLGRQFPIGSLVTVSYEYGATAPPDDLRDAMILRCRERLHSNAGGIPSRTTQVSNETGTTVFATAGRAGYETGIPDVDAVYARYTRHSPVFA